MGIDNLLSGLRAVGNEGNVHNSNLVGSLRTGYKATNYSYGGNGSQDLGNGLQIPDQSLVTSHTSIDFNQGTIVNTGQQTDFAINGDGFFLVQQLQDVGVTNPTQITRDGSFKFTNAGALGNILTTSNGLAVLRDNGAGVYTTIDQNNFLNNNFRPSIVMPTESLDSLKFSKMGATVFDSSGNFVPANGTLVENSLEASNSDVAESITAMSLTAKKFEAMVASIKVDQNNLQTVIDLFK